MPQPRHAKKTISEAVTAVPPMYCPLRGSTSECAIKRLESNHQRRPNINGKARGLSSRCVLLFLEYTMLSGVGSVESII